MALQGFAEQRATLVPDRRAGAGEGLVQCHALVDLLGDAGQQAQFAGQGPEHHRSLHAFAAQAFEHALGVGGLAVEGRVKQTEHIEAGAIGHRGLYGAGIYLMVDGQ